MKEDGYSWWINRIDHYKELFDGVRIDHFRGLDRFWSIPVSEKTAINGTWEKADGAEIFKKITNRMLVCFYFYS